MGTFPTPHWPIVFFNPRKTIRILSRPLARLPPPSSGFPFGQSALFDPNVRLFWSKNPALKPKITQFVRIIDLASPPTFSGPIERRQRQVPSTPSIASVPRCFPVWLDTSKFFAAWALPMAVRAGRSVQSLISTHVVVPHL